jgi:hypothetical protein
VVGADRCGVAVGQRRFELQTEVDFVCVHLCLSVWVGWVGQLRSPCCWRVSHEALPQREHPADKACFSQSFRMFSGTPTNATHGPVWRAQHACPRGRTSKENATVGPVFATVRSLEEGSLV